MKPVVMYSLELRGRCAVTLGALGRRLHRRRALLAWWRLLLHVLRVLLHELGVAWRWLLLGPGSALEGIGRAPIRGSMHAHAVTCGVQQVRLVLEPERGPVVVEPELAAEHREQLRREPHELRVDRLRRHLQVHLRRRRWRRRRWACVVHKLARLARGQRGEAPVGRVPCNLVLVHGSGREMQMRCKRMWQRYR
jgi:hypothetical protein